MPKSKKHKYSVDDEALKILKDSGIDADKVVELIEYVHNKCESAYIDGYNHGVKSVKIYIDQINREA